MSLFSESSTRRNLLAELDAADAPPLLRHYVLPRGVLAITYFEETLSPDTILVVGRDEAGNPVSRFLDCTYSWFLRALGEFTRGPRTPQYVISRRVVSSYSRPPHEVLFPYSHVLSPQRRRSRVCQADV